MKIDKFGLCGSTFKLLNGGYMDLLNPDHELMDLQTIATALSRICRFGGHTPQFYSVAEHSIHATAMALRDGIRGDALRAILLHDATEAFLGDMIKPLKNLLPQYVEIEARFAAAIEREFNVLFDEHKDVIRIYDRAMLKCEKLAMWPEDGNVWAGFDTLPEWSVDFKFWTPEQAASQFIVYAQYVRIYGSSLDAA